MIIWRIYIYGCWQYHTPSANIDCFLIFKLYNNLYKCWITKSSSEDINHINLLLTSRLLKLLYSLLISSKNSFLSISSNFGHFNKKWHSSSISILHNLHLRSCAFHPRYLTFSISKSWALIRNFVSKKWECAWWISQTWKVSFQPSH